MYAIEKRHRFTGQVAEKKHADVRFHEGDFRLPADGAWESFR